MVVYQATMVRCASGGLLRGITLALAACMLPTEEAAEEWSVLSPKLLQSSRTLLSKSTPGPWYESPLESQVDYCKCSGYSVTDAVAGHAPYRTELQDATPAKQRDGLELKLDFDERRDIGFDTGPRYRQTVSRRLTQTDGATRFCGESSKGAVFKETNSQLKLPTPINVNDGVYTVSAWVLWPPAADPPDNPRGMRVLASGFGGDLQVAMNNQSELGLSIIPFRQNATDSGSDQMRLSSSRSLQEHVHGPNVQQLDDQDESEKIWTRGSVPLGESEANSTQPPHNQTVNCQLSDWTKWGACNQTWLVFKPHCAASSSHFVRFAESSSMFMLASGS